MAGQAAAVSREVARLLDDACLRGGSPAALARALQSAGGLAAEGAANPVAQYSTRVVDTLPKHWGGAGSAAIPGQLEGKINSHAVLVNTLQQGGVLACLPASAVRAIFEASEKLHAVAALRGAETRAIAAARPGVPSATALLDAAIQMAGRLSTPQAAAELGGREPWEVFYAAPCVTATAFLQAASHLAADAAQQRTTPASSRLLDLATLAHATQAALAAAAAQRQWHQSVAPEAANSAAGGVAGPQWTAQEPARQALLALSQAALQLQAQLLDEAPGRAAEATVVAADAADGALAALAAALAASEPADVAAVQAEYGAVQDALLQPLLTEAERLVRAGEVAAGQALLTRVESSAQAHRAYPLLFDICALLGDRARLHAHMATDAFQGPAAPGWTQSFAAYAFDRLEAEGKRSDILDMPDHFTGDVAEWLAVPGAAARRAPLQWLHHLRQQQYSAAAAALQELAQGNVAEAQRALALGKLAALAAAPDHLSLHPHPQAAAAVQDLDARLNLLGLQEALGLGGEAPLHAAQLAAAALGEGRSPADAQLALRAFAAAGPQFLEQYGPMLEQVQDRLVTALQLPSREFL